MSEGTKKSGQPVDRFRWRRGHEIHLQWCIFSEVDSADAARVVQQVCSASERQKISRYATEQLRHRAAVARIFTRYCLAEYTQQPVADVAFVTGEHGKPHLADSNSTAAGVHFSISHHDTAICVAVTTAGPIGVDIEAATARSGIADDLRPQLPPAEQRWITNADPGDTDHRAQRLWTLKEAYLKCTGTGLLAPLTSFTVHLDQTSEQPVEVSSATPGRWVLGHCPGPPETTTSVACQPGDHVDALHVVTPCVGSSNATQSTNQQAAAPQPWASWWASYQNQPTTVTAQLPVIDAQPEPLG